MLYHIISHYRADQRGGEAEEGGGQGRAEVVAGHWRPTAGRTPKVLVGVTFTCSPPTTCLANLPGREALFLPAARDEKTATGLPVPGQRCAASPMGATSR